MSVTRINKFEAKDGMADNLHAFLASIVPLIKQSQGCESCQLLRNQENANELVRVLMGDGGLPTGDGRL